MDWGRTALYSCIIAPFTSTIRLPPSLSSLAERRSITNVSENYVGVKGGCGFLWNPDTGLPGNNGDNLATPFAAATFNEGSLSILTRHSPVSTL